MVVGTEREFCRTNRADQHPSLGEPECGEQTLDAEGTLDTEPAGKCTAL